MVSRNPFKLGQIEDKIALREKKNTFTEENEFIKPLKVGEPVVDKDAVNKGWVKEQGYLTESSQGVNPIGRFLYRTDGIGLPNGADIPLIKEDYYGDEAMFALPGRVSITQSGLYRVSVNLIFIGGGISGGAPPAGHVKVVSPAGNNMVLEVSVSDKGRQFYFSFIEEITPQTNPNIYIDNALNTGIYEVYVEVEKLD